MTEYLDKLERKGIDVKGSMTRFSDNEQLYIMLIKKFVTDDNYPLLIECLNKKDYENAIIHAHTLKGVASNLGLNDLADISSEIVKNFKLGNYSNIELYIEKVKFIYEKIITAIK